MERCRTIKDALQAPILREVAKAIGEEELIVCVSAAITQCMLDFYSPKQRLTDDECFSFAEMLVDEYNTESVGDVRVFLKRAGMGRYGDMDSKGRIVKKGQTFGPLTLMRLGTWFEQYLSEKADENEKLQVSKKYAKLEQVDPNQKLLPESPTAKAEADAKIDLMVKQMRLGRQKAMEEKVDNSGRRVHRLMTTVAHMSDDRLRHAYRTAQSKREQHLILQEANHRGLVQKYIEQHLKKQNPDEPDA